MVFLEKNLEDIIFETKNSLLQERGLRICGRKLRQVRIGNYGICDLITVDYSFIKGFGDECYITVYELKKDKIDAQTFFQSINYYKGVVDYANKRYPYIDFNFKIVLVGKTIDMANSFCYLPQLFDNIEFVTYSYEFDGIKFNDDHENYSLINKGF